MDLVYITIVALTRESERGQPSDPILKVLNYTNPFNTYSIKLAVTSKRTKLNTKGIRLIEILVT